MINNSREQTSVRATAWIKGDLGQLSDLSREVIQVTWVTVFRFMEALMEAEGKNGPSGLTKDALAGGDLTWRLGAATRRLELLRKMIPIIRQHQSKQDIAAASELLIDILKWEVIDAGNMSSRQRVHARQSAKADSMYQEPVPLGIL